MLPLLSALHMDTPFFFVMLLHAAPCFSMLLRAAHSHARDRFLGGGFFDNLASYRLLTLLVRVDFYCVYLGQAPARPR